ncbi:MAG: cyclase family protein [Burkholderiales bacterium]
MAAASKADLEKSTPFKASVVTQWDGLAHPMIRVKGAQGWKDGNYFYNGVRFEDVSSARGLKKLGAEKAGGFSTPGILIDIAMLKGVKILPKGYAITMADYKAALAKQAVGDATQGDVVLFRTGWNALWKTNHLGRPVGEQAKTDEQLIADKAESAPASPACPPRFANTWHRRRSP